MERRTAHRAPGHPVARRAKRLGSAAIAAALFGLPLVSVAPAHADASSQWPLKYLKASQVWSITKGSGVTVAILDTGVASIPDTQSSLLTGADFSGGATSTGNGQTDIEGHGTEMAVTIAGAGQVTTGLAPDAKILPVRITVGATMGPDAMAAGVRYAISQHVSVINLSQVVSSEDSALASAIQDALNSNIVVVAGTGNTGASTVAYPAAYPGVVAVGAIDQSGSLWSNSGTGSQVSLAAPGVSIPQEDENASAVSGTGTSASTAYVSATVALVRAEHPSWTVGQVIRDLIGTADPGSGQAAGQHSDQYGYGIVDPLKALQAAAPGETSNPLLAAASSSASAGATGAATATATGGSGAAASSKSSSGLVIGIVVAVVVVLLIIVLILVLSRRNRNRRGGGGPGAGAGGGGQYPQQNPYGQQANPYVQQNPQGGGPYGQPQQQQYPQGGGTYGQPPQQYPYPPQNPPRGQPPQR